MVEDNGRVVCVVDDDASLRRSLRNLLTSVGFRVETFQSAETFLETVHRENTGCVVLDLRMTGMNGLNLLRHLGATSSGEHASELQSRVDVVCRLLLGKKN